MAKEKPKTPIHDDVEALKALVALCLKQIRDLHAQNMALMAVLHRRAPFDQAEWDSEHAKGLAQYDEHVRRVVGEATEIHKHAMIQRLLEMHDSKPQ